MSFPPLFVVAINICWGFVFDPYFVKCFIISAFVVYSLRKMVALLLMCSC